MACLAPVTVCIHGMATYVLVLARPRNAFGIRFIMKTACYFRNATVFEQMRTLLKTAGYESTLFDSEMRFLRAVRSTDYDLLLIDMPTAPGDDDGIFSWLGFRGTERVPTIVTSPLRGAEHIAYALDRGADDFVARPFERVELLARINALMRRCKPAPKANVIDFAGFALNRDTSSLSYLGTPVPLTSREFSMAWLFFSSPGKYISRETIGNVIWSADSEIAGRTIEQHVYKLRKKLNLGEQPTVLIRTAYNQGYRLELCGPGDTSAAPG